MTNANRHVLICGAGLAGGLTAVLLGRRGYRVTLCERRSDPRVHGFRGGRSINLALSTRGLTALDRVGLAETVLKNAVPMRGRQMHAASGKLTFQAYSKDSSEAINSVSRGDLNIALLTAADAMDNVTIRFDCRCVGADLDGPVAEVEDSNGQRDQIAADILIGADGAYSQVRETMRQRVSFDFSQSYLEHGYKELTIPPTADGGFALEPNALHIWPRGGFMMIALPNADRSFTCTLFWPLEGPRSFDQLSDAASIERFFAAEFGDAVPLIPDLVSEYQNNPVGHLATMRCYPWHVDDRVVLIGDAAHAVVPFYGQGINAGFEDCRILDELLDEYGDDWSRALPAYTRERKPNGDAIADMAIANFLEMRDHVGSPLFLLGKRWEKLLHRVLPQMYIPLYNLVSFSNVPYAIARASARRMKRIVNVTVIGMIAMLCAVLLMLLVR